MSLESGGIVVSWVIVCIQTGFKAIWDMVCLTIGSGNITYVLKICTTPIILITLVMALITVVQAEIQRSTNKCLLAERQSMAIESYEHMRSQHEEVMILRHDMTRHFSTLRSLSTEASVTAYLDELLGQAQDIRPVAQTRNQMLDILLNSKLSIARDKGIQVELIRASAPKDLPLSDKSLCSLMLNILDNAIAAAQKSDDQPPFLRLDIHVQGNFLTILCENSFHPQEKNTRKTEETVPKHGLGLKIIGSVVSQYDGILRTEFREDCFHLQIAIPLT